MDFQQAEYNYRVAKRARKAIQALRTGKQSAFRALADTSPLSNEARIVATQRHFAEVTEEEFDQWKTAYEQLTPEEQQGPWGDPLND